MLAGAACVTGYQYLNNAPYTQADPKGYLSVILTARGRTRNPMRCRT